MNRFSLTRKIGLYALNHPKALELYIKIVNKKPTLPRGYRKITRK